MKWFKHNREPEIPEHDLKIRDTYCVLVSENVARGVYGVYYDTYFVRNEETNGEWWETTGDTYMLQVMIDNGVGFPTVDEQEAAHRKRLAAAWSAWLELALETKLDDTNMSVLEYVLQTDHKLRERYKKVLFP